MKQDVGKTINSKILRKLQKILMQVMQQFGMSVSEK